MKKRSAFIGLTRSPAIPCLLGAASLALPGCNGGQAWYTGAAAPASAFPETRPTTIPLAPELSLFGEEAWSASDPLPTNPLPNPRTPDSVDVARVTFAEEGADFDPAVSADGRFLVFASTQHHHNPDLYLKASGSTILTQLTSDPARDVMPAVSPDGEWVAFASDRTLDWNIYVIPRTGGRPVQITWESAAEIHPSWSPDGARLAYSKLGQTSGRWEIWITDVANSAAPQFVGYGLFPEWCPKAGTGPDGGDLLVFQRSAERGDRAFGVWLIELKDGKVSSPSQLIASPSTAYINPSWSPDGRHVVFASIGDPHGLRTLTAEATQDSDLWMMAADGSTMVSLTNGASADLMPAWGNDGRIYFVSTRTGRDNVWSMDARQAMVAAGLSLSEPLANAPTEE